MASKLHKLVLVPYLLLALSSLFWAGNFIVGRALHEVIQPLELNFWRWSFALLILMGMNIHNLTGWFGLKKFWRYQLALALTGIVAFHSSVYVALQTSQAVNALLFLSLSPIIIVLGSWLLYRDRINLMQIAGIFISLAGVLILLSQGSISTIMTLQVNIGDVWMLFATIMWSIYSILLKQRPTELSQISLLTGSVLSAVVILFFLVWLEPDSSFSLDFNPDVILGIVYVGIFASVLAFLFWNYGVIKLGPNRAGVFLHLMPLFGAVLSINILHESIEIYHMLGALFIFSGIAVSSRHGQIQDAR